MYTYCNCTNTICITCYNSIVHNDVYGVKFETVSIVHNEANFLYTVSYLKLRLYDSAA